MGGVFYVRNEFGTTEWLKMKVDELRNTFCGMTVAGDDGATRMTLFVQFRNGVEASWFRRVFFEVFSCLVINHFVKL